MAQPTHHTNPIASNLAEGDAIAQALALDWLPPHMSDTIKNTGLIGNLLRQVPRSEMRLVLTFGATTMLLRHNLNPALGLITHTILSAMGAESDDGVKSIPTAWHWNWANHDPDYGSGSFSTYNLNALTTIGVIERTAVPHMVNFNCNTRTYTPIGSKLKLLPVAPSTTEAHSSQPAQYSLHLTWGVSYLFATKYAHINPLSFFQRHTDRDWGTMNAEDKRYNESDVAAGGGALSAFVLPEGEGIRVDTNWAHTCTTIYLLGEN